MGYGAGGNVTVVEPAHIRREVRNRLYHAWNTIKYYEESDKKDPIDFEELKKKKREDAQNEMMYDVALSIEMEQRSKTDKASVITDILKGNRSDKNV